MTKSPLLLISLLGVMIFFSSCANNGRKTLRSSKDYSAKKAKKTRKKVYKPHIAETSVKRAALIREAKKYRGIPYKYGGKKPQNGFDCSGFSTFVLNRGGFDIQGSSSQLAKKGNLRAESKITAGDLAFFGSNGKVSHVAIVLSRNDREFKVIHSTSSKGVIISDLKKSKYWRQKYLYTRDVISKV